MEGVWLGGYDRYGTPTVDGVLYPLIPNAGYTRHTLGM